MQTDRRLALFSLLALCATTLAQAAPIWREAVVEMSDGELIAGDVSLVQDSLLIYNEEARRRYPVKITAMARLENLIEAQSMEKKFLFKEDGRDEKIFTGETFPRIHFRTRVTFGDGQALEGHALSRMMLIRTDDGEQQRHFFRRKIEGEVGQTIADLVHVKSVTFAGGGDVLGSISGRVRLPAGERLKAVMAINTDKLLCLPARLPGDGVFRVPQCMGGPHDLVAVTERTVYAGFGIETADGCGRFGPERLDEIRDWAAGLNDFFHAQDPLYGAGNEERAFVLVRMERYGGTALPGAALVRRYEVWQMRKPADEWQIAHRFYIARELSAQRDDPREGLVVDPRLAGYVVAPGSAELDVELDLAKPPGHPNQEAD